MKRSKEHVVIDKAKEFTKEVVAAFLAAPKLRPNDLVVLAVAFTALANLCKDYQGEIRAAARRLKKRKQ